MRPMFSLVSVLFVGLLGCRSQGPIANQSNLASNTGTNDPSQICPAYCAPGTLCRMPDGSCTAICNSCYCTREGGTVVGACPKADATPRAFQNTGVQVMAAGDVDRAR